MLIWTEINPVEWEAATAQFQFYVLGEHDVWSLDIFDAKISNNAAAHLDTLNFDNEVAAKAAAEQFLRPG